MMKKEELFEEQPIVRRIFSRALKEGHLSHAYLFSGPKEAHKKEWALLLARSLFCEHPDKEGFACGRCDGCLKIEQDNNPDFFWLKPGKEKIYNYSQKEIHAFFEGKEIEGKKRQSIVKEDIQQLAQAFSRSAQKQYKVFLIEDYDKATTEASNAFLKFLEEPAAETIGFLLSDHVEAIMDTIVSRCQQIHFKIPAPAKAKAVFIEQGCDEKEADFFARAGYSIEELSDFEKERLDQLLQSADEYLLHLDSLSFILRLQQDLFPAKENGQKVDRSLRRKEAGLFLQRMLYGAKAKEMSLLKKALLQSILLNYLEKLNYPLDIHLLLDGLYYELYELWMMDEKSLLAAWKENEQ